MTSESRKTQHERHATLAILIAFVASRLFYYLVMGIHVDHEIVIYATISVDPVFFREQFWSTLYNIHSSPPLFQLVMNGLMAAFGDAAIPMYFVIYTTLGLALAIGLHRLLLVLGIRLIAATIVTIVFTVSPQIILYETWLYNTYPVCVLLVWSCVFAARILDEASAKNFFYFFAMLGLLALIRQIYHVFWIVIFIGFWIAFRPSRWRAVAAGAAIPLLIVGAVYLKNFVAFGSFAGSSWSGLYLSRVTVFQLDEADRRAMIESGVLSPLADMNPFARPSQYHGRVEFPPETGVLLLDRELWETSNSRYGAPIPNYNNRIYPIISRIRLRDAIATILHRPDVYALTVLKSLKVFLRSPIQDDHVSFANRAVMPRLESIANILLYLQVPPSVLELVRGSSAGEAIYKIFYQLSFSIVLAYGLIAWLTFLIARATFRRRSLPGDRHVVISYMILQIGFITAVYLLLENGENSRFRFEIEPLLLALSLAAFVRIRRSYRTRRQGALPANRGIARELRTQ